jgi:hypothetical protein
MALLAPWWLGLLLLGGWVLYLHWQRRSQRQQRVASLWIWQRVVSERRASRRSRPPLLSWALALQLLSLLAVVLALSQPWWGQKPAGGNHLFVLENSLAMQGRAAPQQPTHLDWARQKLARQLRHLPHNARIWLLVAGSQPYWLAHGWSSAHDLLQALNTLEADWGQPNWLQAQSMLTEARPFVAEAQTHFFTQAGNPLPSSIFLSSITTHIPPKTGLNRGFGAVRILEPESGQPFWKIEGQILASQPGGQIALETYTRPLGSDQQTLVDRQELNLSGLGRLAFRVNLLLDQPMAVELRLPSDALTPDNRYYLVLSPQSARRKVLWLGPRSASLEKALSAAAPLDFTFAEELPADQPPADLTVVNQTSVARHPGSSVLWVAAAIDGIAPAQAVETPAGGSAHYLARGITWSRLKVASAHPLTRQPGAEVIWGPTNQPLIQARTTEQGREVWLAFALEDSNWSTLPDLPAFASNWLAWSNPQPPRQCWSGQECPWPSNQLLSDGEVWLQGSRVAWSGISGQPTGQTNGPQYWLDGALAQGWWPLRAGFYQLRWGSLQQEVAVNAPVWPDATTSPTTPLATQPSTGGGYPLWFWLLAMGLLMGGIEFIWQGYRRERLGELGWRRPSGGLNRAGWVRLAYLISGLLLLLAVLNPVLGWPQRVLASLRIIEAAAQPPSSWPRNGLLWVNSDLGLALQQAIQWAPYPLEIGVQSRGLAPHTALLSLHQQLITGSHRLIYQPQLPRSVEHPYLINVSGPDQPRPGQPFLLEAVVYSPQKARHTLQIERNDQVLAQQEVDLQVGENRVEVELVEGSSGWINYQLRLVGSQQAAWRYTVKVGTAPRLALLTPDQNQARSWQKLLAAQGIEVEILSPDQPNLTPNRLSSWQGLMLANYPARNLTPDQQQQLERWVRQDGGGLALMGGPSSFGPGGYYKTPLDRLSPVSSKVPNEAPKAALLFVIDKSGSMNQPSAAGRRIDIARAATLEAIRLLHPESLVGVIAYDTEARVWLPLQRPGNLPSIESELGRLEPGGGTALQPALQQALRLLTPVEGLSRHVILLSDGLSEVGDFEPLARAFTQQNISLSTVAVGEGSDVRLVEQLARWGGGSWYIPQNWEEIPAILTQETLLRSASPRVDSPFRPTWTDSDRPYWLSGWPEILPILGGFVKTTLKPGASLWLSAPGNLPLLAHWRYGSGEVLAFTSNPLGDWAGDWPDLAEQAAMWTAALRPLGKQPSKVTNQIALQALGPHLQVTLYPDPIAGSRLIRVSDGQQQRIPPLSLGSEPVVFSQIFTPRALEAYRFVSENQAVQFWGPPAMPPDLDWVGRMTSLTLASQGRITDQLPPPRYIWRWQPQPSWLVFGLLSLLSYLVALGLRYRV